MTKSCGTCFHYAPLKGEPPAGYCEFVERPLLPFWMDKEITAVRAIKGCDAYQNSR